MTDVGTAFCSDSYPKAARDALIHFYSRHYGAGRWAVKARLAYLLDEAARAECSALKPDRKAFHLPIVLPMPIPSFCFETLTLIQTRKVKAVPVLLFGKEYWERVIRFDQLVDEGTISPEDLDLFQYVETAEEAWRVIRSFYTAQV